MYTKVTLMHSAQMRCIHQISGLSGAEVCALFKQYPKSTVYRHMKKSLAAEEVDRRHENRGRPKKLSERDRRNVARQVPKLRKAIGHFTSKAVEYGAGIDFASNRYVG